jgi:hypothetical protein
LPVTPARIFEKVKHARERRESGEAVITS